MDDKELLEQAAKATGEPYKYWDGKSVHWPNEGFYIIDASNTPTGRAWNPLTDDGDALRLAVKLAMRLGLPDERSVYVEAIGNCQILERVSSDPYAATRRAIVRAAAEIGKAMK